MKKVKILVMSFILMFALCGCSLVDSKVQDIKGQIKGNTYNCMFYSNMGDNFMNVKGEKIELVPNIVKERTYDGETGNWGYTETISSVVTITIDGHQLENCGSTVLFAEDDLKPDADFKTVDNIESNAKGIGDNTIIAGVVNKYKNYFGKPTVVVIQSQLGTPICAYSGDKVYWEVCQDLPKTTKLMIDGKALYIHRANFQIIDKALLEN